MKTLFQSIATLLIFCFAISFATAGNDASTTSTPQYFVKKAATTVNHVTVNAMKLPTAKQLIVQPESVPSTPSPWTTVNVGHFKNGMKVVNQGASSATNNDAGDLPDKEGEQFAVMNQAMANVNLLSNPTTEQVEGLNFATNSTTTACSSQANPYSVTTTVTSMAAKTYSLSATTDPVARTAPMSSASAIFASSASVSQAATDQNFQQNQAGTEACNHYTVTVTNVTTAAQAFAESNC